MNREKECPESGYCCENDQLCCRKMAVAHGTPLGCNGMKTPEEWEKIAKDLLEIWWPHGYWIDSGDYVELENGYRLPVKMCSNCHIDIVLEDFENYCPNCGAKMDLEGDKSDE